MNRPRQNMKRLEQELEELNAKLDALKEEQQENAASQTAV